MGMEFPETAPAKLLGADDSYRISGGSVPEPAAERVFGLTSGDGV